jgi:hypothetical protein
MRLEYGSHTSVLRHALVMVLAGLVSGCVGSTAGQMIPDDPLVKSGTYYVEKHEKDGRDFASMIAERMRARGLPASSGTFAERPEEFDYLVTYVDRWMWDMRMYLSDLRIDVRDRRDSSLVGFGQSSQSSLKAMGKSHDDVIEAALNELFGSQ